MRMIREHARSSTRPINSRGANSKVATANAAALSRGSTEIDHFKFRIESREGRHFFKHVRFTAPHYNTAEEHTIVKFFEGRCLESITLEALATALFPIAMLPRLQDLIGELREVFCD